MEIDSHEPDWQVKDTLASDAPWASRRRPVRRVREQIRAVTSSWVFHLFLSIAIMTVIFLHPPTIYYGDTDTARNYLNTIVSSLSTILALCISIILVAIQLTASNYTHRVLDFFVRLPYNASLFVFYLVTIMHSFFLMARIRDPVPEPVPKSLRPEMSADMVMVVICFISLIMYMYAVVQLLKPERIINLIMREYDRAIARGQWTAALDNIDQICDIAKRAASVSDSATGTRCVDAMLHTMALLPVPEGHQDTTLKLHQHIVNQWVEMVGVAVKERETGLLYAVLGALQSEGLQYVKQRAWAAAELVIKAYRNLVFGHLLPEGQTFVVEGVAEHLYRLAARASQEGKRGEEFCLRTWQVVLTIGENALAAVNPTPSLFEGFLMVHDIERAFGLWTHEERLHRATEIYFAIWKSFLAQASKREAARWALWWKESAPEQVVFENGRSLAVLIALHLDRRDIAETVCHQWRVALDDVLAVPEPWDDYPDVGELGRDIFDGWPWHELVTDGSLNQSSVEVQ